MSRRVETFGNIAHVFSTYESRRAPGEKPFARGINSFQLVRDAKGWKVMTILWDSEREGNPIAEIRMPSPQFWFLNRPSDLFRPSALGFRIFNL